MRIIGLTVSKWRLIKVYFLILENNRHFLSQAEKIKTGIIMLISKSEGCVMFSESFQNSNYMSLNISIFL